MITYPNAKINLGLHVLNKRSDGYHNIETVMVPIPLCDILEIEESSNGHFSFTATGIAIDGEEGSNLCVKAYEVMRKKYSIPAVRIHLHKIIPTGAGLGGGSSDGAFTIKMTDRIFNLGLSDQELEGTALTLGSDCPFFIRNEPVVALGRGEQMEPMPLDIRGLRLVLVKPSFSISTSEAYMRVSPQENRKSLKYSLSLPVESWKGHIVNDFEEYVTADYPEAEQIKRELYLSGALYVQMTGSGSVYFGLFGREPELTAFIKSREIYNGLIV